MKMTLHTPSLNPMLRKLVLTLRNRPKFVKNWANAASIEARNNARSKPGKRWWRDLARSVQLRKISQESVLVSSNQVGANIKQYGGVITPKRAKALTIPVAPEARGKTAFELNTPLRPLFRPKGTNFLARQEPDGSLKVLFILTKKSTQKPDPWFPSDSRINALANREAQIIYNKEQAEWNTR